jgi:DNA-binding transcriptional LysR family regulator
MQQKSQQPAAIMQQGEPVDLERISWDDLRLFITAARFTSFRKAAMVLRTASSTVTRRIERLESDLGIRLFNRVPEGVILTGEGHRILRAAEEMERASLALRSYLDRDIATRGLIRCSITEGLGTFWVLPRLAEFHRANPYTIVDLKCTMDVTDVIRLESDVAVHMVRPTNPDLMVVKLGRMHVYTFGAPRYLETYGAPRSVAELLQHKIIDQTTPELEDGMIQASLGQGIDLAGTVAVRTNSSTAHYYAIELGIGLGALPTYAVPLGASVVPLDLGLQHYLDIWLTYHPDVRSIPRVALFIDWLRDQFNPQKYPWFRDEFIHPKEFLTWTPPEDDIRFEEVDSVVFNPSFRSRV